MRVVVVVPAYNEERTVGDVVARLRPHADAVVVVDDGSSDATGARAATAGAAVVTHAINRGQGAALRTGTDAALRMGADVVVHLDADGQHDTAAVAALVAPIAEGRADIVYGSRFLGVRADGMPLSRRALLWAARQFSAFALGIPRHVTDPQSGLRAMSAPAARTLDFRQDRMAHCSELLRLAARSSYAFVEIPTRVTYTRESLAKGQKASDAFHIVWQLLLGSLHR